MRDTVQAARATVDADRSDLNLADLREYAWQYFSLHADQRLKTFNFFLILATVLVGGSFTALNDDLLPRFAAAFGFYALVMLSFVFWKLDKRNQELVHHGEAALKAIEAKLLPKSSDESLAVLSIFRREEEASSPRRQGQSWHRFWWLSYSDCFALVLVAVSMLGAVLRTVSVFT